MYARVCSNISGLMYQSMVYAKVIGSGWVEQYIVYNKSKDTFELVDYLDETKTPAKPYIHIIQPSLEGFKEYSGAALLKYKQYCKNNNKPLSEISRLFGYPDLCENYEFLSDILTHRKVPRERYDVQLRDLQDAAEWHYIKTQEDANSFINLFVGFHDSTLESINYMEDRTGKKEALAVFDNSSWFGIAELCFEGVQMLKIVPAGENYSREITRATLLVDDSGIFWADDDLEKPDYSYEGSIIQSLSLKWRKKT